VAFFMSNSTDEIATCRVLNCVISRETLSRVKRNKKRTIQEPAGSRIQKPLNILRDWAKCIFSAQKVTEKVMTALNITLWKVNFTCAVQYVILTES
jgi:hypothetical protein